MTLKICGVRGYFLNIPLDPCAALPTETIRFRCEQGHEKDRELCAAHAGILLAQGDLGAPLCGHCSDLGRGDVPIVPIAAEVTP